MKRLEDIPKKVDFKAPDGYFDSLPTRIQSRIAARKKKAWQSNLGFSFRYALPVVALVALGIFWYQRDQADMWSSLENIEEVQIAMFLDDPDLTSEELAESVTWTSEDLDELEQDVFETLETSGNDLDALLDEIDLENL